VTSSLHKSIREQVEKGISILRQGGIIAYPTDTVYGLGASSSIPKAIEKIYSMKNRPLDLPLPLLAADISQVKDIAHSLPDVAELFMEKFFPGALTLVLPASDKIPGIITAGGISVAVRIPDHPVPIALAKGLGSPIIGTSANLSGLPSPQSAEEVYTQLGDTVDFIIDGGRSPGSKESTIIDVTEDKPVILREGAISIECIREIYPEIVLQ